MRYSTKNDIANMLQLPSYRRDVLHYCFCLSNLSVLPVTASFIAFQSLNWNQRPGLNIERSSVYINPRGKLRDYACVDTARLQLVRGNPGVRTCYCVGKLRLTDDWQHHELDLINLLETLRYDPEKTCGKHYSLFVTCVLTSHFSVNLVKSELLREAN